MQKKLFSFFRLIFKSDLDINLSHIDQTAETWIKILVFLEKGHSQTDESITLMIIISRYRDRLYQTFIEDSDGGYTQYSISIPRHLHEVLFTYISQVILLKLEIRPTSYRVDMSLV